MPSSETGPDTCPDTWENAAAALDAAYAAHACAEDAGGMRAYMRDRFAFYGLKSSERRALDRSALALLPPPGQADLGRFARACWAMEHRELQHAACDVLRRHVRGCDAAFISEAEFLITTKSWWDTVDTLAQHVVGGLVLRFPDLVAVMDEWIASLERPHRPRSALPLLPGTRRRHRLLHPQGDQLGAARLRKSRSRCCTRLRHRTRARAVRPVQA